MSQHLWKFFNEGVLSGYTLIVPSVAVGNVGQLACDLLISSLCMDRVATLHSPAFIPVIGHNPYDLNSTSLSGSCDLYQSSDKKLLVLQLRAPLVYKYANSFLSEAVAKFKGMNVKDIIILTSSFAHEKKHILTSPFRYIANESCPYIHRIVNLNWQKHEPIGSEIRILGGGFATVLYEQCVQKTLPCLILYRYCAEGDNIPDAYDMINQLTNVLPIFGNGADLTSELVQPVSWKLLFGRPPPQDIY